MFFGHLICVNVKDLRVIVVLRVPPEPGINVIKLFFFVAAALGRVFPFSGSILSGRLLTLPANTRPAMEKLGRANALAYFAPRVAMKKKMFFALTPGVVPVVLGPSMSRQNLNNKADVFPITNYTC